MEERERLELIQGFNDRLLYLKGQEREEFLNYVSALFCVYAIPSTVLSGENAIKAIREQEKHCNQF